MDGPHEDSDEVIDADLERLVSIPEIAALYKKEASTVEKWYYHGVLPPLAQKRPRRWRLAQVHAVLTARTDNRLALTDEQVDAVLLLHNKKGWTQTAIAKEYNVSIGHISNIVNGKRRKHVKTDN